MAKADRWSGALPSPIAQAIADLERYFRGEKVDFSTLRLDLRACSPFHKAVYDATRAIGWGAVATYGDVRHSFIDRCDYHGVFAPGYRRIKKPARAATGMSLLEIARGVGSPGAARAVGHALSRNPIAIIIPCHRILAAGGKIGGFSAHGGTSAKARLLEIEGARLGQGAAANYDLFSPSFG
jgi:methylated-DNA-[protein]-cysteine S-methyltransferase